MAPEPDYVLRANDSASNGSVAFTYRNGERADETTMTVSLVNGNETYTVGVLSDLLAHAPASLTLHSVLLEKLASNVSFYNSWYVNATLTVVYDQIPDGNYSERLSPSPASILTSNKRVFDQLQP